jgi:hypothetical protein
MQEVTEYVYYDGSVTVTIATPRLDSTTPSAVMVTATVHEEFAAKVRAALDTLAVTGKITIVGDAVAIVVGKRGRPAKVKTATATA